MRASHGCQRLLLVVVVASAVFFATAITAAPPNDDDADFWLCDALKRRAAEGPDLYESLNGSAHSLHSRGIRAYFKRGWDHLKSGSLFHCLAHRWFKTSEALLDFMLAKVGPDMAVAMLNDRSESGELTPVMVAAAHGLPKAVSAMVERGADWTLRDKYHRPLLCAAVCSGNIATVKGVLKLHSAAGSLDAALEEPSCLRPPSSWGEAGAPDGAAPVLWTAVHRDDVKMAALLLRAGARLTAAVARRFRPLTIVRSHAMLATLRGFGWDPAEQLDAGGVTAALATAVERRDHALGEDVLSLVAPRVPALLSGLPHAMVSATRASAWRGKRPPSVALLTALLRSSAGNATLKLAPGALQAVRRMRPDVFTVTHAAVAFSGNPEAARALVAALEARDVGDDRSGSSLLSGADASRHRVAVLSHTVDAYGRRLLSAAAGGACSEDVCRLRQVAVYVGIRTLQDGTVVPIRDFPRDAVHELVCFAAAARNDALLAVLAYELSGPDHRALWTEPCSYSADTTPLRLALASTGITRWQFDWDAERPFNPHAVAIVAKESATEGA